jgi:monoterpene epsilon-lactone hydrolase
MSWQARVATPIGRALFKRRPERDSVERMRARFERRTARAPRLPAGWERIPVNSGPLRGEWVRPQATHARPEEPAILYVHGGGYVSGTVATHRPLVTAIALAAGMRAFSLEYRRAPEYPFPAAVNDAEEAYRALLDQGIPAARMVLVGDSAGGGLALATVLAARDHGVPLPAGLWLISPLTDQAATGESLRENDRRDAMFYGDSIRRLATIYLQGTPATHPLASPLYADLTGLPPLCIHASDSEILRDDAIRLAERARAADVEVTMRLWHAVPHVWQFLLEFVPEARESVNAGATFLCTQVARISSPVE